MKLVFDMSSVMWNCLLAGKDTENGYEAVDANGKAHPVNTAAFGYERAVNQIKASLTTNKCTPIDCIFVVEGMNSKARRVMMFKEYKNRGVRPLEQYEEFNKLKDMLTETFRSLGSIFVKQDNVESDDVIAYIAGNSEEDLVIHSQDNDLLVLSGVNKYGAKIDCYIGNDFNYNKYGHFEFRFITLYKATVGDSGDKIPGIQGFGPAKWEELETRFGDVGLDELCRLAELGSLEELAKEAEQDKLVGLIYKGRESFLTSWKLAKLHPEWVDTMADAFEWTPGLVLDYVVDDERLNQWKGVTRLITAEKFDEFLGKFKANLALRPYIALDIETSTPEESDEWLANQGKEDGVDVIGSELSGMSLTFGPNMNFTVYIPVDHKDTNNVSKEKVFELLKVIAESGVEVAIHNTAFEGPVLFNEFGKQWLDNGFCGFIPNWLDTKLEASYVDESFSLGLKKLSKRWLNYDQTEYKDVTTVNGVRYKMRELTGRHVFDYACDDTITTAALHNFFKFFMELEHTYKVYKQVELDAAYLHAQSFTHGTKVSLATLSKLQQEDQETYKQAWATLREYLLQKGWEGSNPPKFSVELTPTNVKEAYKIVTGEELVTMVRKMEKLIEMVEPKAKTLAELIKGVHTGAIDFEALNGYVASHFNGEPEFNAGSPKQLGKLFYDVLELPVKVYNPPTDKMRADGNKTGTPKTDALAISYGLMDVADDEQKVTVLKALRLMKMVQTREGLYYKPYPGFIHWKTGRVHSSHNQCATNTRRASSSMPNVQQLAKNGKVEGYSPRIREIFVPHKRDAVIVSMDFSSQEILLQAEWCKDPALMEVFVGENPKDMHSITGVKIFNSKYGVDFSYDEFKSAVGDKDSEGHTKAKATRALGKAVNFGTQYRIAAKKLSTMLFVTETDAQMMIDAKAEAFPVAEQWALDEMALVKQTGKVYTMLGAVRHLRSELLSTDRSISSKADRQAISFRIQGSAAEMTKLAEGAMFRAKLEQKYDCEVIASIHDEVVASVTVKDLIPFIKEMHACMVANYAGMTLPIKSSISFGPNFGSQVEVGDWPTEEAIEKGIAQLTK